VNLVSKSAGLAFESCLSETGPTRGGGVQEVQYILSGPGKIKVRMLSFSAIKPKLLVQASCQYDN